MNMDASDRLNDLDKRFVKIYEAARADVVERQQLRVLIVIDDDRLLLYRHGYPAQTFPGLQPPLYTKLKTLGHTPLAVFCLLGGAPEGPLDDSLMSRITDYRAALASCAQDLDTSQEPRTGVLRQPSPLYAKVMRFLDGLAASREHSHAALAAFAGDVGADIGPLLAAAARAQLDSCDALVRRIRRDLLSREEWRELRVLVLGPYMARQGDLFLQYFAKLLDTPMQGDKRLVYYDGDDLVGAFDRLGTVMLDAMASHAIFGDRSRLHRDVLADGTARYLEALVATHREADQPLDASRR
jgi:hypothetical protein